MRRCLVFAALVAGVPWMSAGGQQVTLRLIEADSGGLAAGAIVTALRGEETVSRHLANRLGVAVVQLPAPGLYRFRIDRIGRVTFISDTFTVRRGGRVIRLTLPSTPFVLPDVIAHGASLCPDARGARAGALTLWEEARKALLASSLARGLGGSYEQRLFTRQLSLLGMVLSSSGSTRHSSAARPFLTHDPSSLQVAGYVRRNPDGGFAFFGPDEDVLLSESFLTSHCFGLWQGIDPPEGLVGLRFQPTERRGVPDITGTLWLERETNRLREVEFRYTDLPEGVDFGGVGGRVGFDRRDTGAWFVSAWSIRTPIVVRRARVLGLVGSRQWVITGYHEEGGTARPVP